jgi:mannose/fructose/N-acetylgalactosamine-specific phosphotransferase system component IIB
LEQLEYNVVEDLKKMKANISVMDLCRIPQQKTLLLQELKDEKNQIVNPNQNINKTNLGEAQKSTSKCNIHR